jgi:hypothetical protein
MSSSLPSRSATSSSGGTATGSKRSCWSWRGPSPPWAPSAWCRRCSTAGPFAASSGCTGRTGKERDHLPSAASSK